MFRLVMIPVGDQPLPAWRFDGFRVERPRTENDGLAALAEWPADVILLVAGDRLDRTKELCALLEAEFAADLPPVLVATHTHVVAGRTTLVELNVDAVIDLAWSEAFAAQSIEHAVARVRSGRGVASIQHELLRTVSGDIHHLRNLSIRDELTGLFNLRHFREVVEREHTRCRRHSRSYALAVIDLDNLRLINNNLGHAAGTRALLLVARAIACTMRESDHAFRIGGDEFVVLLMETESKGAWAYAERVREMLRSEAADELGGDHRLSISVGISSFPEGGANPDAVLESADAALYRAKSLGRDQVFVSGQAAGGTR